MPPSDFYVAAPCRKRLRFFQSPSDFYVAGSMPQAAQIFPIPFGFLCRRLHAASGSDFSNPHQIFMSQAPCRKRLRFFQSPSDFYVAGSMPQAAQIFRSPSDFYVAGSMPQAARILPVPFRFFKFF
jgi:hypothetical protein